MSSIHPSTSKPSHDPDSRYENPMGGSGMYSDPDEEPASNHPLDSEVERERLKKIEGWYTEALSMSETARYEQHIDEAYYDGDQWTEEEAQELAERRQSPIVLNHVKPAVDWVMGTERRTRQQNRVIPRREGPEFQAEATAKSQLLKYLDSVNNGRFARSSAFAEAVKSGVGWLEDAVSGDPSGETLYSGYESWRNMLPDPFHRDYAMRDARYIFRTRWMDLDMLEAIFPDRAEHLRAASESQDMLFGDPSDDWWLARQYTRMDSAGEYVTVRSGGNTDVSRGLGWHRPRVFAKECWFREPLKASVMRGAGDAGDGHPMHGSIYRKGEHPLADDAVERGHVTLQSALALQMRVAIYVDGTLLLSEVSPYRHNDFPFTPIRAYRKAADLSPYGVIRNARDPQDDMNKRASKSIYLLSTNQVIADEKAVDDWDETAENASDPAGIMKVKGDRRFELVRNQDLAAAHISLMDRDQSMIRNASGVQGENLGMDTNATSGKAVKAKQDEGSVVTFELFDNLALSMTIQGHKRLSLIEQYYSEPKVIRLAGERGATKFVDINTPEVSTETGEVRFLNDVTRTKSDFALKQEDHHATLRQAMAEELMEMIGKLSSDVAIQLLDVAIEMMDFPGKDEFAKRIRKINNQAPPEGEESEDEAAERKARSASADEAKQLEQAALLAEFKAKIATGSKTSVDAQKAALEVGQALGLGPAAANAADQVLKAAGFMDHGAIQGVPGAGEPPQQAALGSVEPPPAAASPQPAQTQRQDPGQMSGITGHLA